jgi:hypothetical protein
MQKILFVITISFSCLHFSANASEPFGDAELTAHASSTASSTTTLDCVVHNDSPITTGFFDRTLEDKSINNDEKLRRARLYVTDRKEAYQLFLEQIGANYFRTKFLQDKTLQETVLFMVSFFEKKLASLERKHRDFKECLEPISEVTKNDMMTNPIGQYSGKLRGNSQAQAEYAASKVKSWELIVTFVYHNRIPKVSTNPIIQRAIEEEEKKLVEKFSRIEMIKPVSEELEKMIPWVAYVQGPAKVIEAKQFIDEIAQKNPVPLLNTQIDDQYDIFFYAASNLRKWENRLGEKEKIARLEYIFNNIDLTDAFKDKQY